MRIDEKALKRLLEEKNNGTTAQVVPSPTTAQVVPTPTPTPTPQKAYSGLTEDEYAKAGALALDNMPIKSPLGPYFLGYNPSTVTNKADNPTEEQQRNRDIVLGSINPYSTSTGIEAALNKKNEAENQDLVQVAPIFEPKKEMGYSQPTIDAPVADAAINYIREQYESLNPQRGNKIDSLIEDYLNREDFRYDPNADMLYQNYLAAMQNAGQMAMRDTMGQAAMLTGGYGSSYATAAANGAYNSYLQKANEALPDYYNMAANAYDRQGQDMLSQIQLLQNQDDEAYNRWLDQMKLNGTGTSASTEEAWTPTQENKTRQEALSIYKEKGEKGLFEYLDSLSGYNLSDETIKGIMDFVEQYGQNDWEMTKDAWGLFPVARNQYTDSEGKTKTYSDLEQEHKEGKISDEDWELIKSLTKKGQTTKDRR